jgi:hypothetical protein
VHKFERTKNPGLHWVQVPASEQKSQFCVHDKQVPSDRNFVRGQEVQKEPQSLAMQVLKLKVCPAMQVKHSVGELAEQVPQG